MKKFLISIIALLFFVIFNNNNVLAGIPAPDGMIWVSSSGADFANGTLEKVTPIEGGFYVKCKQSSRCCWEITDGGKNLELYTQISPMKPGPIEDSETEIKATPEPINP